MAAKKPIPEEPLLLAYPVEFDMHQNGGGQRRLEHHNMLFTFAPDDAYWVLKALGWNVSRREP